MFEAFFTGFLMGGIISAIATVMIWTRMENKRISAEVEKTKRELTADIHRIMDEYEQDVLSLIDKYGRGGDF
jgi:hypothetical protein